MKRFLAQILLLVSVSTAFSQSFEGLFSEGELPDDFINLSSSEFKGDINQIENSKRSTKKSKEVFYLNNRFNTREMLYSGLVVFNDPISKFCNNTLKELLRNNPDLPQNARVYIIKKEEANAFATDQGIIFVTIGLVARVKNESQLAFVLAHELGHVLKKHNVNQHVENDLIKKEKGNYRGLSQSQRKFSKHAYSRNLESEADDIALEKLKNTKYKISEAESVFDVLTYASYPYDLSEVNLFSLNSSLFKLSNKVDTISTVPVDSLSEFYDDTLSTHPSTGKRREKIQSELQSSKDEGVLFIQDQKEFQSVQLLAIESMGDCYLSSFQFFESLLHGMLRKLDANGDQMYNSKLIAKSLYMISKIKNKEGQIDIDIEDVDGEISKILKLGLNLNHVELNQLAMGYAYDLHKKDPKDKELLLILEDLINDELVLLDGEIGEETKPLLKGVDEMYEKMVKYVQVIDNGPTVYDSDPKYGVSLGIDKIVFVDPVHKKIRYDYKRVQEMLIDEEKTEIELNEIIDKSAATTKLEYTILDDKRFDKNSTSAYNDFVEIEQWANFRALSRHIDLNAVDIYKNSSERIRLKYGTNTFVWTGVLSLKVIPPKVIRAQRWIAPALDLAVGTLPFLTILTTAVRNYSDGITKTKYDTYYYFIMIDLETGKSIYEKTEECDRPDSKGNVGLWIYDLIHQVNKK